MTNFDFVCEHFCSVMIFMFKNEDNSHVPSLLQAVIAPLRLLISLFSLEPDWKKKRSNINISVDETDFLQRSLQMWLLRAFYNTCHVGQEQFGVQFLKDTLIWGIKPATFWWLDDPLFSLNYSCCQRLGKYIIEAGFFKFNNKLSWLKWLLQ